MFLAVACYKLYCTLQTPDVLIVSEILDRGLPYPCEQARGGEKLKKVWFPGADIAVASPFVDN